MSVYSLEEDRCIESQAADDAPCDPASVCLEQGRCRAGQCLGIARRCDDNDALHRRRLRDGPGLHSHPARVPHAGGRLPGRPPATRSAGCGEGPAPDLTECGPAGLHRGELLLCRACASTQPTPEGLPCSPAIACLPEAQCRNQQCTRITEADWVPDWSARLHAEPTGGLASSGATLFFSACRRRRHGRRRYGRRRRGRG